MLKVLLEDTLHRMLEAEMDEKLGDWKIFKATSKVGNIAKKLK